MVVAVAVDDPRLLLIGREAVKEDRRGLKKKMGKLRSKFICCGSAKDVVITSAHDSNGGGGEAGRSNGAPQAPTALSNGDAKSKKKNKRVTIREDSARSCTYKIQLALAKPSHIT